MSHGFRKTLYASGLDRLASLRVPRGAAPFSAPAAIAPSDGHRLRTRRAHRGCAPWIVLDPALRLVARLVDEARVAADGRTPTRTDELATVLSGGQLADHELSAGAARAGRIARHCAGGDQ